MPTEKELDVIIESEIEFRPYEPGPGKPSEVKLKLQEIKEGDSVEYIQVGNQKIITKVLKVKPDGNLILDTKKGPGKPGSLIKNVCVKPHRVKKV